MSTERSDTSTSEPETTAGGNASRNAAGGSEAAHDNGSMGSLEEDGSMVDWREQLRERVRQIRARKMAAQRAAETGYEEPREVAESIAASAARAEELRRAKAEEARRAEVRDSEDTVADDPDAATSAARGGAIEDEDADARTTAQSEDDVLALDAQEESEDETEASSSEDGTDEDTEDRHVDAEIDQDRDADAILDEIFDDLGSETDRSYDDQDTPGHTTFELDEPTPATEPADEPDVQAVLDEAHGEATPTPSADAPIGDVDAPEEGDMEPPASADEVPLFQEDAEPFDEAPVIPDDDELAARGGEDPATQRRQVNGWWPRPPRDEGGSSIPEGIDIPAWARSQARRKQEAGRLGSGSGSEDDADELAGPAAGSDDGPATTADTDSAHPGGHEQDDDVAASGSDEAGAPSELADVPIPSWAHPRRPRPPRAPDARGDLDDIHLVGEFRGRGSSRRPADAGRQESRDTTAEPPRSADAGGRKPDDAAPHGSPSPDTAPAESPSADAGDRDDLELPFLGEKPAAATADDRAEVEEAEAPETREKRPSALEELLGQSESPGGDDIAPRTSRGHRQQPRGRTAPEQRAEPASRPATEPAEDRTSADTHRPAEERSVTMEEGREPDETHRPADELEPAGDEARERAEEPWDELDLEDADPRPEVDADDGAVPAAARSGLDLDDEAAAETDDRDLEWDLDTTGDPETVLHAQRPPRQVDESSAPISDRFFSALCDALVLLAVALLLVAAAGRASGASMTDVLRATPAPLAATWLVFAFAYAVFFNGTCGQTLGKMIMRVRVIGAERFHIGYGRAARRAASYLLATLPAGLGLLPALRAAQHRALHDRLSGTRVVKA